MGKFDSFPPRIDWDLPWQSPDFPPPIPDRPPVQGFASKLTNDKQKQQDGRQIKSGRKKKRRR